MANFLVKLGLICFIITYHSFVLAEEESFFTEHERGWHWYDDPKKEQDEADAESINDPIVQMDAVRAAVKRALNQAVITPTKENVKHYIELQNQVSNQSNKFSHTWQAVLLDNPNLDYSLAHPTNNLAKQVESDQHHLLDEKMIRQFAQNYQLYFFYRSTCPYCQRFAPILKDFAETYGFNVLPITTDGISLPEFPDSYINQGESKLYNVTVEPTVFAVSPVTHKAIRIATGLMSQTEMKNNIVALITHFEGDVR